MAGLAIILGFALLFTFIVIRSRNILLGLVGSLTWILLLVYTRNVTLYGIPVGSFGDSLIIYICWIMAVVTPLTIIVRIRNDKKLEERGYAISDEGHIAGVEKPKAPTSNSIMEMDNTEFREYLRTKLKRNRR